MSAPRRSAKPSIERDALVAQRDAALDATYALLGLIDRKSYMTPEQQSTVRSAEALLVEFGRKVR